jgi:citrate lyase beta subunit
MEDSAQDLFDYQNNLNLKIIARNGLSYLSINNFLNKINFYVRINSQISKFYEDDIAIIQKVIMDGSPIKGIFLPVTSSAASMICLTEKPLPLPRLNAALGCP